MSDATADRAVLEVRDLAVEFPLAAGAVRPVIDVAFSVGRRKKVGLVGESGSGKSLTALALMRLLPPPGRIAAGNVLLGGRDLTRLTEKEMAAVRGGRIAMVYQDPMSSLNPVRSIGRQIVEAIRAHEDVSKTVARARAIELLADVGIAAPARRFDSYPHQLSGGMRQRVMIAMAISANPDVLIADEPTTALDVTTQARIVDLLGRLVEERDLGRDPDHTRPRARRDASATRSTSCTPVGSSSTAGLRSSSRSPVHPYSEALLGAICRLDEDVERPIAAIGGQPPLPQQLPPGCSFHPRCPYAFDLCHTETPGLHELTDDRQARCHLAEQRAGLVAA